MLSNAAVHCAAHNGFIYIDVAIADFQIKTALRIGADPCFVFDGSALAPEVRERDKVACFAFLTFGKAVLFH